jgi:F-type H+-transporting ATPase subunit epsilon
MQDPYTLSVKVLSPTQTLYDGPANSVSAKNRLGPFDILPEHANFFSLLTQGNISINTGVKIFSFKALHGIIKVSNNKVTLFIYTSN